MAKICPSSNPASRSAWMSAGVVELGSLATFRAHAADRERFAIAWRRLIMARQVIQL